MKEVQAKSLLIPVKNPDSWFGVRYNMNIYRGCEHGCIYCDSRSECYKIDNFNDVIVKVNAVELILRELKGKRSYGTIGTGAMSDPYTYAEKKYNLTGEVLKAISMYGFPVHIVTKSDLILKDLDVLVDINRSGASIGFTVTTSEDKLARRLEPSAPVPSRRFAAMKKLSEAGIYTGTLMMPILPFLEDSKENIKSIVRLTAEAGGRFIIPWFGVTLRDRQRAYFYNSLDKNFMGIREKYEKTYGSSYFCEVPQAKDLMELLKEEAARYNMVTSMKEFNNVKSHEQLRMF